MQATAAKGPLTQANFGKVINAGWTIKPLADGIADLTFPVDHVKEPGCFGTLEVEGARYIMKEPFACDPSDTLSVSGG